MQTTLTLTTTTANTSTPAIKSPSLCQIHSKSSAMKKHGSAGSPDADSAEYALVDRENPAVNLNPDRRLTIR